MVVDNASTQTEPSNFWEQHPDIQLIRSDHNSGFAAANNQAIHASLDFEWIALLNPDAFPEPDWLARLIEASVKNPEYDAFGSRQLMAENPTLLDGDGDVYHLSGLIWRDGYSKPVASASSVPHAIFAPCAAAALYRRAALMAVGGFDEDFFCYVEDVDLGFRLRLNGYQCLQVPGAVVHHIGSGSSGGHQNDMAVYHGHRNLVWCFVKNMPIPLFWLLLPVHLVMTAVVLGVLLLRGQGRVVLQAKRDALKGIPKMWRKRTISATTQTASSGQIWKMLDKSIW